MSLLPGLSEPVKHWIDAGAVAGLIATLAGQLPQITALVMLIWGLMRLYETWLNIKIKQRDLRGDE